MDIYRAPEADLGSGEKPLLKPVRAIVYGLCVSVILTVFVSLIEGVVFGMVIGADFTDINEFESALAGNSVFLLIDVLVSLLILFAAGRVTGKCVPGKELRYAGILIILNLALYVSTYYLIESSVVYPVWYDTSILVVVVLGIYFGARSTVRVG